MVSSPVVVALAGPNGAGKSTTGPPLLKETLGVTQFVNADLIAEGLAAFDPAGAALFPAPSLPWSGSEIAFSAVVTRCPSGRSAAASTRA